MTAENVIFIRGGAYTDVKKALRQWMSLYHERLEENYRFLMIKKGRGRHIIVADKRLDNVLFYFLVNYLKYPESIEYKINVEGYTRGKKPGPLFEKDLLVYVPEFDEEFDNVYAVTSENKTYKVDFGGKVMEVNLSKIYKTPDEFSENESEVIKPETASGETEIETSLGERKGIFRIISIFIIGVVLLNFLILKRSSAFFVINYIIGTVFSFWLYYDYKMLQINSLYLRCLVLSILFFFFGYALQKDFGNHSDYKLLQIATALPLFFLVFQRFWRWVFIKAIKREPEVKEQFQSLADTVYKLVLIVVPVSICLLYYLF